MLDQISTQASLTVSIFCILKEIFQSDISGFSAAQVVVGLVTWLARDGCLLVVREMRHGQPQGDPGPSPPVPMTEGRGTRVNSPATARYDRDVATPWHTPVPSLVGSSNRQQPMHYQADKTNTACAVMV